MKSLMLLILILFPSWGFSDIITPEGYVAKYHGEKFFTEIIELKIIGKNLSIKFLTNLPFNEIDYNIADLKFQINKNTYAVKLTKRERGKLLKNPIWENSSIFNVINESCKKLNNEYIDVKSENGTGIYCGYAMVKIIELDEKKLVEILIPLILLENGYCEISWGTAFCGNCLVEGEIYIPNISEVGCSPTRVFTREYFPPQRIINPEKRYPFSFYSPWGDYPYWLDDTIIFPYYPPPNPPAPPPVPIGNLLIPFGVILLRIFWYE